MSEKMKYEVNAGINVNASRRSDLYANAVTGFVRKYFTKREEAGSSECCMSGGVSLTKRLNTQLGGLGRRNSQT